MRLLVSLPVWEERWVKFGRRTSIQANRTNITAACFTDGIAVFPHDPALIVFFLWEISRFPSCSLNKAESNLTTVHVVGWFLGSAREREGEREREREPTRIWRLLSLVIGWELLP